MSFNVPCTGPLVEQTLKECRQPVLDPSTVFDNSGPFEDPLTDDVLRTVKEQLGHRLPTAYIALASTQRWQVRQ